MPSDAPAESHVNRGTLRWLRVGLIILSMTTFATLSARQSWSADLLANLRVQQLLALFAGCFGCLILRRWSAAVWTIMLIAIHLPWIVIDNGWHPEATTNRVPLTITMANAKTSNLRHADVVADLVARDPDVIAVLEVSTALAKELARQLSSEYPHSSVHPQDSGNFGIAVFSRYPLRDLEAFTLNLQYVQTIEAIVRHDDNDYLIVATHPIPPMTRRGFELRNKHLRLLAEHLTDSNFPDHQVLIGDLNVTPWSPIFSDFLEQAELKRAQTAWNITPTWYRGPALPFGLVLDHGLISPNLNCLSHEVGPDIGSDHRSITIKVAPVGDKRQNPNRKAMKSAQHQNEQTVNDEELETLFAKHSRAVRVRRLLFPTR